MPDIATYDPKKVTFVVNGRTITGFAEDSMINVTANEDTTTPTVGCQGDIAFSESANESGNIELSLMSTSSSLPYLRELAAKRKALNVGIFDANDDDAINMSEESCRILKKPDRPKGKAVTSVAVNIFVPRLSE